MNGTKKAKDYILLHQLKKLLISNNDQKKNGINLTLHLTILKK